MVLIIPKFFGKQECQFWKDYCMFASKNKTLEVGLKTGGKDKMNHVDRNYYTVRSHFTFMDKLKETAEKHWEQKLYYSKRSYAHLMHYKEEGQGLEWHAEPGISTVSVSINLSSSDEYEGADFEIKEHDFDLKQGDAVFYSSGLLHQVTPLSKGHKKSFVLWLKSKKQYEEDK